MIFFKHVLFRTTVSYQAGSLLMSSRLGRARLYSADCVGPMHKECYSSPYSKQPETGQILPAYG